MGTLEYLGSIFGYLLIGATCARFNIIRLYHECAGKEDEAMWFAAAIVALWPLWAVMRTLGLIAFTPLDRHKAKVLQAEQALSELKKQLDNETDSENKKILRTAFRAQDRLVKELRGRQ